LNDLAPVVDRIVESVIDILAARWSPPSATYRLQFNRQFTFRDAAARIAYLASLGVSHIYAAPYLKARAGSTHGYDICDHGQLNPELGTPDDYARLVQTMHDYGMEQILDVVPNHMSVATRDNAWWQDVLENGPASPYAHYFDINWRPVKDELTDKVLLPLLGEQFGEALEAGSLVLAFHDGTFVLHYGEYLLPLAPESTIPVLSYRLAELVSALGEDSLELHEYQSIVTALEHLPARTETSRERIAVRQREKEVIKRRLAQLASTCASIVELVRQNVFEFNGRVEDPQSFDRLDQLLSAQAYRLCHWKAASDEINYRRFFDINELAALCMENPDVFESTHRIILQLLVRGDVSGLRIDHIDGLYDPADYLWRLQRAYVRELGRAAFDRLSESPEQIGQTGAPMAAATAVAYRETRVQDSTVALSTLDSPPVIAWEEVEADYLRAMQVRLGLPDEFLGQLVTSVQPESVASESERPTREREMIASRPLKLPLYIVVEKILGPDEPLPHEWPTAGTTGYDFLYNLNGLFVDPAGLREMVRHYGRFIGAKRDFAEVAYRSRLLILRVAMASELQLLAQRLNRISEQHRRSRDFTLNMLRDALREILACFPVYRTYASARQIAERDRRFIQLAVAQAKRRNPAIPAAIFDFIRGTLLLDHPPGTDELGRLDRELFLGRFQQVTSPLMAKGVEDTAFYVYCPLVSLSEVGGEPHSGATSLETFHRENSERLALRPHSMLCTTTHDTKRSEDVRARINVLSEVPQLWRAAVHRWSRFNRRLRREVDGLTAPSRNDEYFFYQTLVGVWPLNESAQQPHADLVTRLQQYMEKATHEAKLQTSWLNPNAAYDHAVREFVAAALADVPSNRFLADLRRLHEQVVDWGLYTALAQLLLKLTSPGVPDIYQGQELWDLSLVDPDNRRAVDYELRKRLLSELDQDVRSIGRCALARRLAAHPRDDRLKLYVTALALRFRRANARLFQQGGYEPLSAEGDQAGHVCAFAWRLPSSGTREGQHAIIVVPRFVARLAARSTNGCVAPPTGNETWGNTSLVLRDGMNRPLRNLFTGERLAAASQLPLGSVLADFPVAVLFTADLPSSSVA